MVILWHNLGNSQVSVYRTIGPTLFFFQRKDGYNYECDVMQLFEFGSLHHDYYLVNIRVPVEPYMGVNMGIGKLTGMTLVVCIDIYSL